MQYGLAAYNRDGARLLETFEDLWAILEQAVQDSDALPAICILVALDECNEYSRGPLLKKISSFYERSTTGLKLKMIVTSRPHGTIRDVFATKLDIDSMQLKGENEAEKKEIMVEIDLVTGERVKQFQDRRLRRKVDDDAYILLLIGYTNQESYISLGCLDISETGKQGRGV